MMALARISPRLCDRWMKYTRWNVRKRSMIDSWFANEILDYLDHWLLFPILWWEFAALLNFPQQRTDYKKRSSWVKVVCFLTEELIISERYIFFESGFLSRSLSLLGTTRLTEGQKRSIFCEFSLQKKRREEKVSLYEIVWGFSLRLPFQKSNTKRRG